MKKIIVAVITLSLVSSTVFADTIVTYIGTIEKLNVTGTPPTLTIVDATGKADQLNISDSNIAYVSYHFKTGDCVKIDYKRESNTLKKIMAGNKSVCKNGVKQTEVKQITIK